MFNNKIIDEKIYNNLYQIPKKEKKRIFEKKIKDLTFYHLDKCQIYKKIIGDIYPKFNTKVKNLDNLPMIPVRLFKHIDLMSIKDDQVYRKLLSSGTSSNAPSKIYLDKENAQNQIKALNKIFSSMVTEKRYPMLIIGSEKEVSNKSLFNAQKAAILGFSIFSKKNYYLLDQYNKINFKLLNEFFEVVRDAPFFIFGFTSRIYNDFFQKLKKEKQIFKNAILIHGGGWKKLESLKIDNSKFKKLLKEKFNISKIINYYGLVEQTGSIFIESEKCGYFHTSSFSDVLIRDQNFKLLKNKQKGLIQLISLLPSSYPGHNILTEDLGEIFGEDDCVCGLKGKYFKVHGRIEKAEIRGCGNIND